MRGFVQIPIIVIILLISGGVITAYTITHKHSLPVEVTSQVDDATSSAKEASGNSENSKPLISRPEKSSTYKPSNKPSTTVTPTSTPQAQKGVKTPAITGTVLTQSGNNMVGGYTMYLRKIKDDGNSDIVATTVSDEKGVYLFENVQPGKYQTSPGSATSIIGDLYITITSETKMAQGLTIKTFTPDPSSSNAPSQSSVKLDSISLNPTKYGDTITIKGSGFGSSGQYVIFTNPQGFTSGAGIISWSDTEIKAYVPPTKGENKIQVEGPNGAKSNVYNLQVIGGQPYISNVTPTTFKKGASITISGYDFGSSSGKVNFNSSSGYGNLLGYGVIGSWTDTQIIFTVPNLEFKEYALEIVTSDNRKSSYKYFNIVD